MKTPRDLAAQRRALSFLQRGSLVRRSGGWRFGAARIPDAIVERLVASGKALLSDDLQLATVTEHGAGFPYRPRGTRS